jgi:Domain of unknown function (DUF4156)/Short C-terminal domain
MRLVAGFLAWTLAGCATELTDAGQQVRFGKADPAGGCTELGPVFGSGLGGAYTNPEDKLSSAQNDLRNRAAALGANYVVMDAVGSDLHGMSISGRAFRCETLPSNLSPSASAATPTSAPAGDPEARLRKLKELLDKGLITQDDYDKRRAEILQSL